MQLLAGAAGLGLWGPHLAYGGSATAPTLCEPAVSLLGDPADVAQLSRALGRYEIAEQASLGCHRWAVTVWHAGPELTVEIVDSDGVRVVRRASGADVAAALVDSWIHRGVTAIEATDRLRISDPKLAPRAPPVVKARRARGALVPFEGLGVAESTWLPPPSLSAAPSPQGVASVKRTYAASDRNDRARDPFSITLGPDLSESSDGTKWWGGHVGACVVVGPLCAGAILESAGAAAIVGDPGTTRRYTVDLLAGLDVPWDLGRLKLVPGFGLGMGLMQANTSDPPPDNPGELSGARNSRTWGFRTTTHVVLAIRIWGRVGLDVGGAADMSLPARGPASDGQQGFYPAEPRFFLRGGVALRYGAP